MHLYDPWKASMQWIKHPYTQHKGFSMRTENEISTRCSVIQKEGYCELSQVSHAAPLFPSDKQFERCE
jgi:hypothetical protein